MKRLSEECARLINGGAFRVRITNLKTHKNEIKSFRTFREANDFVKNFHGNGMYIARLA